MTLNLKMTAAALGTLCATAAWSADYEIKRTIVLDTPAMEVWHMIGDFCDIDDWHPGVNSCALKVIDGSLARVLTTVDGDDFVQKRIADDAGLSYTYKTVSSSLPIENFIATLSIERFDSPEITWSGRFTSEDPAMEQIIVEAVETGMSAIENAFKTE